MTKENFFNKTWGWVVLFGIFAIAILGIGDLVKNDSNYVVQGSDTTANTISKTDGNMIVEASIDEIEPYSQEWFTQVLYSAKLSNKSSIWTVFLTVGSVDGEVLVETRFQNKDSASGLGALVYQKATEYPNETLILYATTSFHGQVLYFELPPNRDMLELQSQK